MFSSFIRNLTACLIIIALSTPAKAETPRIVASIQPVHSLVASILDGIATPQLIIEGFASPHTYAMTPSKAAMVAKADIIFWAGPELETFLIKPLNNLDKKNALTVALLEEHEDDHAQHDKAAEEHDEHAKHEHEHGHGHDHHGVDPHFWLSPEEAVHALQEIADVLADALPEYRSKIMSNRNKTTAAVQLLDAEIKNLLEPVLQERAIVLHDAYGHFTEHFGMAPFMALTLSPEKRPGPVQLQKIRHAIIEHNIKCVFREPQFPKRYTNLLAEGTDAKQSTIDPLGSDLKPGPGLYSKLMMQMANALSGCLKL